MCVSIFQNSEIDYSAKTQSKEEFSQGGDLDKRDKSDQVVPMWQKAERTHTKLSSAVRALPKGSDRFLNMWCQWCVMKVWTISVPAHIIFFFILRFTDPDIQSSFHRCECPASPSWIARQVFHIPDVQRPALKSCPETVERPSSVARSPACITLPARQNGKIDGDDGVSSACLSEPLLALVCCGEREQTHCVSSACDLARSQ